MEACGHSGPEQEVDRKADIVWVATSAVANDQIGGETLYDVGW